MNLPDATVKTVEGPPEERYGRWWVPVTYDCWGHESATAIMCETKEEAQAIRPGYEFFT